jgi:hypothetical protein
VPEVLTLPMALDMDRHARWLQVLASAEAAGELGKTGIPVVPFRAHETLASSKVAGWASPAHITFAGDRRDWGWRGMSAHPESAIGRIAGSTERRDRTTTVAIVAAAQNGTSDVIAGQARPAPGRFGYAAIGVQGHLEGSNSRLDARGS